MRSQKAGRSSGDRLVVMLPSVTTSSSTTSAPALRRSVRTLGQEVSRRPRARSASTRFHGPWQMEATGLPESTKSRTKLTAVGFMRSWSGLTVPPGSSRASYSSTDAEPTSRSTPKVPASSRSWFRAAISPSWIDSRSVRAPAFSRACRGCSSSTRSTPSAARIATRRPFNSPAMSRSRHRRVEDDLGPAVVPLVEVLVGLRRPVEGQLVAHDERRLGLTRGDEVAQLPVVLLDRRLAAADVLALEPDHAVVEGELALLRQLVAGPRVLRHEDADVADLPDEADRGDQPVHRQIGLLLPVGLVRLVADALAAVVRPQPNGLVEYGLHRIDLRVVDGDRADRLGQSQPVGVPVDDHHLAGPPDGRREGGHQPDRAGAVDDRLVAGLHAGHLGGVVAGREDVGEHHVVGLALLGVLPQPQAVEVP